MSDFIKIESGLASLLSDDSYLLENNISERAITHKLAEHYQKLFPEWNVDCEFNHNLGQPKVIEIKPGELLSQMADFLDERSEDEQFNAFIHREEISRKEINGLKKQLRNPKRIKYIKDLDLYIFLLKTKNKTIHKTIFPDIIVHRRGTSKNHIVFEIKKTINNNKKARDYDILKLSMLVTSSNFKYGKGIFIDLPVKEKFVNFKSFGKVQIGNLEVYEYFPEFK